MKKFFKEFKDFALRGNVMDLAVGVIIGAAFQAVVTSLTDNIISPVIGLFAGADFSDALQIPLFGATLKLGAFITSIINFIIMALVIFLLVRGMNRLANIGKKPEEKGEPSNMKCPYCLTEIPFGATRCPNCTVALSTAEVEKAQQAARA